MRQLLFAIVFMVGYTGISQSELNDYKYIIVPKKFDAFKEENQHQTSTLIKFLLEQRGFNVVYDDNLPMDLFGNRCLGLTAVLNDNSSMFTTKVTLDFLDCMSRAVFSTSEGRSKKKEFKASFQEAIKDALRSLDAFVYEYSGKAESGQTVVLNFRDDVKTLDDGGKDTLKPKNTRDPMVQQKATPEEQSFKDLRPVPSDVQKGKSDAKDTVQQEATKETQSYINKEPRPSSILQGGTAGEMWYAQALPNGYQLVDSTPKIRMKLLESGVKDVYHAQATDTKGMVYPKDGKWWFEYYEGDQRIVQELNIKF